ncbi:hypothetical protein FRC01_000345 [Tulasnella sp. 417]|nr:hypothetical protein FRC01_000345 [Tulasnella sp. 417]
MSHAVDVPRRSSTSEALLYQSIEGEDVDWSAVRNHKQERRKRKRETPAWKRRRNAAKALIQIASTEQDGESIVAKAFVRTDLTQEIGTNAIVTLGAEESDPLEQELAYGCYERPSSYISLKSSEKAAQLLNLVISHSKGSSFFQQTIPSILRTESSPGTYTFNHQASAAIPYLATAFPIQFGLIDAFIIKDFGFWLIQGDAYPSIRWLRGIKILDILVNHIARNEPKQQEMRISVACRVLHAVARSMIGAYGRGSAVFGLGREIPSATPLSLRAALSAILQTENNPKALNSILPFRPTLRAFNEALGNICIRESNTSLRLALRLLVLMRDIPEAKGSLSSHTAHSVADVCIRIVIARVDGPSGVKISSGELADAEVPQLSSDEDAFDVLCHLGEIVFAEALERALKTRHYTPYTTYYTPDTAHYVSAGDFALLEPLLWLSNMPRHIKVAHRALVRGHACKFLATIIPYQVSATWEWHERERWRAKGQAMTCLGNIIERMDESQVRDHVTKEMIDSVVAIRTNEEAPLAQRDQAKFTLQRYTVVADRWGIEPYYREELEATDQAPGV